MEGDTMSDELFAWDAKPTSYLPAPCPHDDSESPECECEGCNLCGDVFRPHQAIRRHHRGGWLHLDCLSRHFHDIGPTRAAEAEQWYREVNFVSE
jgi:hypothetical protein